MVDTTTDRDLQNETPGLVQSLLTSHRFDQTFTDLGEVSAPTEVRLETWK